MFPVKVPVTGAIVTLLVTGVDVVGSSYTLNVRLPEVAVYGETQRAGSLKEPPHAINK
ncbi:MAG: hypothetical protein UV89_C0025G0001 [candidate division WWE3 bacterium GW2011_GWB2_43_22]|uniref:Uncharacterized protein n=1 Tax=candidate division WWE3 bacterium GW2011_GWB2_43_22 TaxID=1619118 RepID=A0A0G1EJF7_UNCKA|nr:MAG: hypothetical protein UV89_C0025G0001 [candidate division WWE3 bacterium GW2011_GWB2_43_22]